MCVYTNVFIYLDQLDMIADQDKVVEQGRLVVEQDRPVA